MLQLLSALTTVVALALASTPIAAKEIKGAPKELTGTYHQSLELCRLYLEDPDAAKDDDKHIWPQRILSDRGKSYYYYGPCDGRDCPNEILSYAKTRRGYVLTTLYQGLYGSHKEKVSVTPLGQNKFIFRFVGGEPSTLFRCPRVSSQPNASPATR